MSKRKDLRWLFKGRHLDREVIVLCVRWQLRYKFGLRNLVEMLAERGLSLALAPKEVPVGHYDPALGESPHAGVCQTLESVDYDNRSVVAGRRDLREDSRQMGLSLPRR